MAFAVIGQFSCTLLPFFTATKREEHPSVPRTVIQVRSFSHVWGFGANSPFRSLLKCPEPDVGGYISHGVLSSMASEVEATIGR